MESHLRSILKAVSWRSGGTVVTFIVAYVVTGEFGRAERLGPGVFAEVFLDGKADLAAGERKIKKHTPMRPPITDETVAATIALYASPFFAIG